MISKEALDELEVFVPPLERQRAIVEITTLLKEEQHIMEKLAERRHQYISTTLIQLAQGA